MEQFSKCFFNDTSKNKNSDMVKGQMMCLLQSDKFLHSVQI